MAISNRMEPDEMIIKISPDNKLVAIELTANDKDRFYANSSFATCTIPMEEFLDELERLDFIAPRPKTTEHQAQGLFNLGIEDSEAGGCGS